MRHELAPRRHSELVLPMMDGLLAEAGLGLRQLDALGFGRGPGSFTGIRIAAAVTQGAAFAADLPVVPVSTLLALAEGARRQHGAGRVLAALDARMNEAYWAECRSDPQGSMELLGLERVSASERVAIEIGSDWMGVGSAWGPYGESLRAAAGSEPARVDAEARVQAHDIAVLAAGAVERGEVVSAERALPVYLRDEVAWKKIR
jgi:tRNA threonylcarbamoyladenosine biosynthesis protein TsaB